VSGTQDAFTRAFGVVVGHEGGFDRTEADPGNWTGGAVGQGELRGTKFGISAKAYPTLDIGALTLDDACAIYRRDYWDRVHGDELPPPLALLVFDAAVNNGVARAAMWLQESVGAKPDGQIGPATLAALAAAAQAQGGAALCGEFQARRLTFMAALPTWRSFGAGWARRLCALPYQSLTMGEHA
jgi:lysozyme family protein